MASRRIASRGASSRRNVRVSQVSAYFGGLGTDTGGALLSANAHYDINYLDFTADNNPLAGFNYELPVAAWHYSMVAPREWGERPARGLFRGRGIKCCVATMRLPLETGAGQR